ncbi:MAG: hypothetical protein JXB00_19785 [Bacteroidales bacterium]|nr:hypothetical protein [Bacteroidales bacterium]
MVHKQFYDEKLVISFSDVKRMNLLNIRIVEEFLRKEIGKGVKYLYLNMEGIAFIDSYAYSRLIAINNAATLFCTRFRLFNVSEELEEIFGLLNNKNQLRFAGRHEIVMPGPATVQKSYS